ncbi:MAG TPA: YciI family protein [Ktedonobacteraceae bacterium]
MDEMKHYLYRIQPTRHEMLTEGSTPQEAEIIGEHFNYLQRLTNEGVAILVGRTLTTERDTMGIVIFKARSDEEAHSLMNADPAVSGGVMSAKLFPFRIALHATGND